MKIPTEMRLWYKERTDRHISLVQKYCDKIDAIECVKYNSPFVISVNEGALLTLSTHSILHDKSKFYEPEIDPYTLITWWYKCNGEGTDFPLSQDNKVAMAEATFHHIKNNPHHPEAWDESVRMEERGDRDTPSKWTLTDASGMPNFYIAEMVADWMAMSEEKGSSVKGWADRNVNIRWKFTDEQKNLIYELVGIKE